MVQSTITYVGDLHCAALHGPSGSTLGTDAPKDNQGKGESFSPTDLVAAALGTCMLTVMGITARRLEIDMSGAKAWIDKFMVADPSRRIGELGVRISVPISVSVDDQKRLENAALTCPVAKSLHPEMKMPVTFEWG